MYCTSCGKQIADDAAFCQYCGKPALWDNALAKMVAAARTGDQDAIGVLYEKTYSQVYYTVKSMIKDEDAVFDIVQDTYIKAFAHLDSFQGDTKFLPWVRQIAANTARDWLKKKRPMLFTELDSGDGQHTPMEELFPDERNENLPDQVIDQQETKRLIRDIIEELPEDQRAAIGMFYYEEMPVKEIASRSADTRESWATENVVDRQETKVPEETEASEETEVSEVSEESTPIDEALEQYRIIISQADSYDYGEYAKADQSWLEMAGYRYALVQMQPDDPVPTLLLAREIMDSELSVSNRYDRIFQYDPNTKTVHQPTEVIADGGIRGGLFMAGDGYGLFALGWSSGTGQGSVKRITLEGDSLNRDAYWNGQIFEMPDSITFIEIEWHEAGDLSALDSWEEPEPSDLTENF